MEPYIGLLKEGGKTIGFQAITRDITERKQMEKKLEEYSEHLEELVEERTRRLKEKPEKQRTAEKMTEEKVTEWIKTRARQLE